MKLEYERNDKRTLVYEFRKDEFSVEELKNIIDAYLKKNKKFYSYIQWTFLYEEVRLDLGILGNFYLSGYTLEELTEIHTYINNYIDTRNRQYEREELRRSE